jgi:hypothetical protein
LRPSTSPRPSSTGAWTRASSKPFPTVIGQKDKGIRTL